MCDCTGKSVSKQEAEEQTVDDLTLECYDLLVYETNLCFQNSNKLFIKFLKLNKIILANQFCLNNLYATDFALNTCTSITQLLTKLLNTESTRLQSERIMSVWNIVFVYYLYFPATIINRRFKNVFNLQLKH